MLHFLLNICSIIGMVQGLQLHHATSAVASALSSAATTTCQLPATHVAPGLSTTGHLRDGLRVQVWRHAPRREEGGARVGPALIVWHRLEGNTQPWTWRALKIIIIIENPKLGFITSFRRDLVSTEYASMAEEEVVLSSQRFADDSEVWVN